MEKICPRCGARSTERKFIENFCADCFKSFIDLDLPAAVEIPVCRQCDRVKLREWREKDSEAIGQFVLRACGIKEPSAKIHVSSEGECRIELKSEREDARIEVEDRVGIKFVQTLCDRCSRTSSGYYEAIIQLRGAAEKVERMRAKMQPVLEANSFISKLIESKRGVDFYVGSRKAAEEALAEFGLTPLISNKLYGVKDGQRVYRTTFSVRL